MRMMRSLSESLSHAVDVLAEKSRRAALCSRLRSVIRSEEKAADQAYRALGRYYYRHLRELENEETRGYCQRIDEAMKRVDRAVEKLEQNAYGEDSGDPCQGCVQSSCRECRYYAEEVEPYAPSAEEEDIPGEDLPEDWQEEDPEVLREQDRLDGEEPVEDEEWEDLPVQEESIELPVTVRGIHSAPPCENGEIPEETTEPDSGSIPQPEVPRPAGKAPQARYIDRDAQPAVFAGQEVADPEDVDQIPFI